MDASSPLNFMVNFSSQMLKIIVSGFSLLKEKVNDIQSTFCSSANSVKNSFLSMLQLICSD